MDQCLIASLGPKPDVVRALKTRPEPSTALFSPARSSSTSWVSTHYTPLVKPINGLISTFSPVHGEAIRDKHVQYMSKRARVTVRVVPNMEALPCLQIHCQGQLWSDIYVFSKELPGPKHFRSRHFMSERSILGMCVQDSYI